MQPYQIVFGLGSLFVKDTLGNAAKIATVAEFSVNISEEQAELYGRSKYPIDVRPTKAKAEGKIKVSAYEPMLASLVQPGAATTNGYEALVDEEAATIPSSPGPYTVTVAAAADYRRNWGVKFTATGIYLLRVASNPAAGQYAVNEATGVYTFAAADAGKAIRVSYQRNVAASGQTLDATNVAMGTALSCSLLGYREDEGRILGYYFPTARVKGMNLAFKAEAHLQPEHEFKAYAAPGETVYKLYMV